MVCALLRGEPERKDCPPLTLLVLCSNLDPTLPMLLLFPDATKLIVKLGTPLASDVHEDQGWDNNNKNLFVLF